MTDVLSTDAMSPTLRLIHQRWVAAVERVLSPAMAPGADFWARWDAARFLIDQFASFYRLEASLFEQLATLLPAEDAARLRQQLGVMERTRARVVALGRRRGTGAEVNRQAKNLLIQIRCWSRDLEDTTRDLDPASLPPACKELLQALEGAADSGA